MSERIFRFLSQFSKYTSGLAIAFGLMVLTGWTFHIQRLKGIIPGQVAVKANAAACFVLIGLALWLAISGTRKRFAHVLSKLLALLASCIGLLSVLEFWKGWDFGIDQLLFTAGPEDLPGSVRLALMSPIAAADFFLLGLAITSLDSKGRWGRLLENLLPAVAAAAAMFGILDFVLDPQTSHTHIAPMTALILFLISFAVLLARAETGLRSLLLSGTVGGVLCRRLLPSAILIPITIEWLRWKGQQTGLYSDWAGVVIMTVVSGVLLASLTVWTAFVVNRADADKSKAEISARNLAAIVTYSNDAIIGKTLDGIVTSWNPGAEAIYGFSAEEMIGQSVSRVIPPDRLDEFEGFLQQLRRGETIRHYETERRRKDGKRISLSVSISPVKDAKGKVISASTIARDITERRKAEQDSADEQRRFEAILDRLPVMVCLLRPDYSVAFANVSYREQFGESNGRKCYEFCFGKTAPCEFCRSFDVLKKGQPVDWEVVIGNGRTVHAFDFPFTDTDGSPLVLEMGVDVTDQKEAERKIKEASRYTRSLIEASLDPLVTISKEGKITDVSKGTEIATGLSRDRLIGGDFCDYFTEPERAREGYARVFDKGFVRDYPLAIRNTSGAVMDVLYNATVYTGITGEVEGVFAAARDITERKRAEEEAQAGRDRLALAMATAKAGSFDWNIVANVDKWSREQELLYGLQPGEFSGTHKDWEAFVLPEDLPRAKALIDAAFQTGDFAAEFRIRRRDNGEVRWMNVRAKVVFGNNGKPSRMVGINLDVTERKLAEEKVAEASRSRTLIEASLDPLVTISADGKITDVNEATEKATGRTRDYLIGSDFSGYFTEPEKARQGYRQVFISGFVRDYPLVLRHTSGRAMEVLYNATVFRNAQGEVAGIFAAARDVTHLKQIEQELRLSRQRLALALKAGHSGTFDWDMRNNVNLWTAEVEEVHGLKPGEFGGRYEDWEALVFPDDLPAARACIESSLKTGEFTGDWRIRRRNDGQIRWITARAKILNDDEGKPWRMIGLNMDVTERKQAEEALHESEEAFRTLAESVPQLVWMCLPDGLNVYFNQRWVDYTGLPREQCFGRNWSAPFHPEDRQPAWDAWNHAVATGDTYRVDVRLRAADGTYRWFLNKGVPMRDASGTIVKWFGTCTDIDDLKRAEAEIRQLNDRLEERVRQRTAQLEAANKELEAFTYSVSHDLRAPLRHISGFSKMLSEEFSGSLPPDAQHHVQRIQEGTRRMGQLVDDLLNLGRVGRKELSLQVSGLRSIVDAVIESLRSDVGDRQLEWKIGDLPYVECDTGLIQQVFQNLLSNAVKFTRPRAKAVIEIGQEEREGSRVVYVRDNGVGFSMKYADKLFGVFQRLHRAEDFEGTGVGLATVQRIVQKHGGRIWAEAELDKGASFYFTLGSAQSSEANFKAVAAGEES